LQAAVKAVQPSEGMARAKRGSCLNYLVTLRDLLGPLQDQVFKKHGYPPNPVGVEKMKADADAAVLAGDSAVAQLSNEMHFLLGLVPIGRGASHTHLHPQIHAALERRAAEICGKCAENLLASNDRIEDIQAILADVRNSGLLSPEEEQHIRKSSEAELRQLLRGKLESVNFKKAKNQCIREFLAKHPNRLGSELREWRSAWAEEAVARAAGCVYGLHNDGYLILDGLLDAEVVSRATEEAAQMHRAGELITSVDACNRGAKAVFLHFRTAEDKAYHRGALPGLAAIAELVAGLPHALAKQDGTGLLSTLRLDASVMVSAYEPGVSYKRHMDSYGGDDNHRMLTVLAYLNDSAWNEESAGALRLYKDLEPEGKVVCREAHDGDGAGRYGDFVDVLPAGGRIVAFLSRRVWHEVRPAERSRYAMTLWVPAPVPVA